MLDDAERERAQRRAELNERLRRKTRRGRLLLGGCVLLLLALIGVKIALTPERGPEPRGGAEDASAERPGVRIPGGRAERLRALAERRTDFVLEDGVLRWTDGAARSFEVAEVQRRGGLVLRTEAGALRVLAEVWQRHLAGPPEDLATIVAQARLEDQGLTGAVVHDDGFQPLLVRGQDFLRTARGVLRQDAATLAEVAQAQDARSAALRRLQEATDAYVQALERTPLDESTRRALAEILRALPRQGGNYFSSLAPAVTRRLIRHGWLRQIGAGEAATQALEAAVAASVGPHAARRMAGPGGRWTTYQDAFDREIEVLETDDGTWYTCPQPRPQWLGRAANRTVRVQLAPGRDPFAREVAPVAARLEPFEGAWETGGGMTVDAAAWRRAMRRSFGTQPHMPHDVFPPHMLLTDGYGDALLLVTQHGALQPARDASPTERTRFFDEAARVLPDVAHMDLIGELLYTYAWDTAAYDRPLLIGTEQFNGDIHQTAEQTLATGCGGIYRGDCDDLACFYHALTCHQGRNAHVLSLPHHLANAYAEQQEDGSWAVAILHTGPPMHVRGQTLGQAIERTMEAFESQESVDLGGLPFSLRFGGDAVRQRYMLPYQVFRDPQYARDLIEVQSAYRFHTYRTGIETMQRILASRKEPTAADHRETAHLLTWAHRHADATEHFRKALAAADAPPARADAALDLLSNLVAAGKDEQARALQDELTRTILPALEGAVGTRLVRPWVRMASALLQEDAHVQAGLHVLAGPAAARVEDAYEAVEMVASRKGFDPRWLHYNGLPRYTSSVGAYVGSALLALEETWGKRGGSVLEDRAVLDGLLQRWFQRIAFRTLHDNADVLGLYGSVASYYEATLGKANVERLVLQAGPPSPDDLARAKTPPAITATPAGFHLRMIHLAPTYHRARWWRGLVAKPAERDDAATKRALFAELAALDAAERQGLGHRDHPNEVLIARIGLAVLAADAKALRPLLVEAEARRDPSLEAAVVRLLAAATHRHAPEAWIGLARVWVDTMGRLPDRLNLAWYAMRDEHPRHAILMGALAAERSPDRADFQRELEHLKQVGTR